MIQFLSKLQRTQFVEYGLVAQNLTLSVHISMYSQDAGIGTSIDSFYEYLLKAHLLFGDEEYLFIFLEAYKAVMHYLHNDPWYVEVNMNSAAIVWPLFNSLQAFWPGLQVLAGDVDPAIRTHNAFFSVWKKYGFTPEGFNLATFTVQQGQKSYPLRPELMESTYWLYKATRDSRYLDAGRDMIASLQYGARCPCGYCHISDVESHNQEDHMESFFLAETVKYLWLLFDLAVGPDNLVETGPYKYIFSTEGHLLPATPEIALVPEHCSYFGAVCKGNDVKHRFVFNISEHLHKNNDTRSQSSWDLTNVPFKPTYRQSVSMPGVIKAVCPGLTYPQKFGISYIVEVDTTREDKPKKQQDQSSVVQTHSLVLVSNSDVRSNSNVLEDENTIQRPDQENTEHVLVSHTDVSSKSNVLEDENSIRKPDQEDTEHEPHQNT